MTKRAEKLGVLSFKNSGTSWLFLVQVVGWAAASVLALTKILLLRNARQTLSVSAAFLANLMHTFTPATYLR